MADKNEAKALLARAGIEINSALHRVDKMSDQEVANTVKTVGALSAFFDQNGSCGKATVGALAAFFDQNGSCAAAAGTALISALQHQVKA